MPFYHTCFMYGEKCVWYHDKPMKYAQAARYCQTQGGRLWEPGHYLELVWVHRRYMQMFSERYEFEVGFQVAYQAKQAPSFRNQLENQYWIGTRRHPCRKRTWRP